MLLLGRFPKVSSGCCRGANGKPSSWPPRRSQQMTSWSCPTSVPSPCRDQKVRHTGHPGPLLLSQDSEAGSGGPGTGLRPCAGSGGRGDWCLPFPGGSSAPFPPVVSAVAHWPLRPQRIVRGFHGIGWKEKSYFISIFRGLKLTLCTASDYECR